MTVVVVVCRESDHRDTPVRRNARPCRRSSDRQGGRSARVGGCQAALGHGLLERRAVFGCFDGVFVGTDEFDPVLFKHALVDQVERTIERGLAAHGRSEEHTSELQSLMRISYAVFCLKKTKNLIKKDTT